MKEKVDLILKHEINCFINRYSNFLLCHLFTMRHHLKVSISIFCKCNHEAVYSIFVLHLYIFILKMNQACVETFKFKSHRLSHIKLV